MGLYVIQSNYLFGARKSMNQTKGANRMELFFNRGGMK